jgi:pyruvate dehydrogenase E2 component (dihydrolipoamide acetyltransferase)
MSVDVVMPKLGESVTEGTVVRWLKKEGEAIERDEPILEIATDKIDTDIPSISDGVLKQILIQEGETVEVGEILAVIEIPGTGDSAGIDGTEVEEVESDNVLEETTTDSSVRGAVGAEGVAPVRSRDGRFYSPLVRSIARREGLTTDELDALSGSGRNGRVTKSDLLSYLASRDSSTGADFASSPLSKGPNLSYSADNADVIAMDNVRKSIAEHMVRSKATSPHVTSFTEIDMTHVSSYRERVKEQFLEREGFKLTLTPFFIAAIVEALRSNPMLNASIDGENIVQWKNINLGLAVGLEKGVIVPVIRNAEEKNFIGLARSAYDLALRAHSRKLSPDELQGGTFTLTNPGMWGTMFGTPIISQPQVGIIATGSVTKRVVVMDDDSMAIRSIMYMSLSYDHRVVDGLNAARYTQAITKKLEQFDLSEVGL